MENQPLKKSSDPALIKESAEVVLAKEVAQTLIAQFSGNEQHTFMRVLKSTIIDHYDRKIESILKELDLSKMELDSFENGGSGLVKQPVNY